MNRRDGRISMGRYNETDGHRCILTKKYVTDHCSATRLTSILRDGVIRGKACIPSSDKGRSSRTASCYPTAIGKVFWRIGLPNPASGLKHLLSPPLLGRRGKRRFLSGLRPALACLSDCMRKHPLPYTAPFCPRQRPTHSIFHHFSMGNEVLTSLSIDFACS